MFGGAIEMFGGLFSIFYFFNSPLFSPMAISYNRVTIMFLDHIRTSVLFHGGGGGLGSPFNTSIIFYFIATTIIISNR